MNKHQKAVSKIVKKQHRELPALSYRKHKNLVKEFVKNMSLKEVLEYKKWILDKELREKEKAERRESIKKDGTLKKVIKGLKKLFQQEG